MRRFLHHRFAAALPAAGVVLVLGIAAGGGPAAAEADPWASTFSSVQYVDRLQALNGQYDGVGVRLGLDADRIVIAAVEPGTSAERAGVQVGEQVVSVDARDVHADDFVDIVHALRTSTAPVRAVVTGTAGPRSVTLTSSLIGHNVVQTSPTSGGDRVVRVDSVTRGAADQISRSLADAPDDAGVILDLRGNGGGLVTEAVRIAGVFLAGGDGVTYERSDGSRRSIPVSGGDDVVELPLVVLVDDRTASAAEIVAGILQDRGRALVIGERTFGKGTVQEPMSQAAGTVRERTVGEYALPSGRLLDGVGLRPDVAVTAIEDDEAAFGVAVTVLTGLAPRASQGR